MSRLCQDTATPPRAATRRHRRWIRCGGRLQGDPGRDGQRTRRDGRIKLQALLDFLRPGDALVVTRIDRLARSLKDLQGVEPKPRAKAMALSGTEQPVDTGTAAQGVS